VGFAIVPAIPLVPGAWNAWKMRSPSEACSGATFRIKVANADFIIPAAPIFNVYLGKTSREDAYYFFSNPSLRTFCDLSDNGKQPVKATNMSLSFDEHRRSAPAFCTGADPDWAKTYCAAAENPTEIDRIDFPLKVYIFAPDEVAMGHFGGSRSTYEDSLRAKPPPNGWRFITSDELTPDQHKLTFECLENANGYGCRASYPWSDGAILSYSFRSGRDDVAARGSRIDAETRKFLSGFKAPH
jgi:hypothetical protein